MRETTLSHICLSRQLTIDRLLVVGVHKGALGPNGILEVPDMQTVPSLPPFPL